MKRLLGLLLTLFLFANYLQAQRYNFIKRSVNQGLPQSQVQAIIQDSDGYLWIGTRGGVSKFDGQSYTTYTTKEGLNNNWVNVIYEDRRGNIWIGSDKGVNKFNGRSFKGFALEEGLTYTKVVSICEDTSGKIWIGTEGGGINYYSHDTIQSFSTREGLCGDNIKSITRTIDGYLLVGTDDGVCKINPYQTDSLVIVETFLRGKSIRDIYKGRPGNYWVATDHRIFKYQHQRIRDLLAPLDTSLEGVFEIQRDLAGNLWIATRQDGLWKFNGHSLQHFTKAEGLPTNEILGLFIGQEGNIWIGTNGQGLVQLNSLAFQHYMPEENKQNIMSVLVDDQGATWLGTNGNGVYKYQNNRYVHYGKEEGFKEGRIWSMHQDHQGRIWMGSLDGGLYLFQPNAPSPHKMKSIRGPNGALNNAILSIRQGSDDYFWVTSYNGAYKFQYRNGNIVNETFTHYSEKDGLNYSKVYTTYEDARGNIWLATPDGVNIFNGKRFYSITKQNGLAGNRVYGIVGDEQGNVWLGTTKGVTRYRPLQKKASFTDTVQGILTTLDESDGLLNNNIVSLAYGGGKLWIGTNEGASTLNTKVYNATGTPIFKNYGRQEGFVGIECDQGAIFYDARSRTAWFGTVKGAMKFVPQQLKHPKIPPETHITDIRLFLRETDWSRYADSVRFKSGLPVNLSLPYDQNHLTFSFIGLSYTIPDKVRYQWKLEGFDQHWSPVSEQRGVTYSNLNPGSYTFKVRAASHERIWNQHPTTYHFVIQAPFWETWWFYALCTVLAVLIVYGVIKLRTKSLQRSKERLEQKVKERTKDLDAKNEELEHANRELKKLSLVASRTKNGVIIANKKGEIEWVNKGFTRMTGYTLRDIQNTSGEKLRKGGKTGLSDSSIMKQLYQNKEPLSYEALNYTKEGEKLWVLTTLTPILDEETNEVEKIIAIDTDITERKKAEEATIEAKQAAEKAKKREEEFIANISHELRTPLNGIIGMTNLLQNENLSAEEKTQYLKAIDSSAHNLLHIINDILDFSKIEAGKMTFETKPFDLQDLLDSIYHSLSFKAEDKGIDLIIGVADEIPRLKGDKVRLNQILVNLVANSLKFTDEGFVKVKVNMLKDKEQEVKLRFAVEDTGVGIPEEKLQDIFESFQQAEDDTSRKYGGTGLGLSIVKKLVKAQGGKVWAESEVGKGTTFYFTLLLEKPAKEEDVKPSIPEKQMAGELSNDRILVAEDNQVNQLFTEKLLKSWDLHPTIVENGEEAVEALQQDHYDLILMDLKMPKMNGYETTKVIRKELPAPKSLIPIIALSAHANEDVAQKCKNVGMNDYITKPFEAEELYNKIKEFAQKTETPEKEDPDTRETTSETSQPMTHQGKPEGKQEKMNGGQRKYSDLSHLKEMAEGSDEFVIKMIDQFIEQTTPELKKMESQMKEKEWGQLRDTAHKMKSAVPFVGNERLEKLVKTIEQNADNRKNLEQLEQQVQEVRHLCYKIIEELKEEKHKIKM